MSVDPEGDGLTQDLSHDPHTKNHAYTKVKHPAKHPGWHIKRPFSTPAQHSKKVPAKQPTFSAHFRIGGTGEGSPEQASSAASAEHITDVPSESSPAKTPTSSAPTEGDEKKESLEKTETQSESTSLSVSGQQNTGLTEKPKTWIESQDPKMQAAMSLANALLSLQVTPPEFIKKSFESASDQTQETTLPTTIMTTTSSADIDSSHPDVALHPAQSLTGNHTLQSLLETFHSQLRSNFVCLLVTIINGPLQTLAIALLLFLGHKLRKEVLELKASNAELMQKVYDVTTAPATPTLRADRRWLGRSESRADWQRGTEVVGGRE